MSFAQLSSRRQGTTTVVGRGPPLATQRATAQRRRDESRDITHQLRRRRSLRITAGHRERHRSLLGRTLPPNTREGPPLGLSNEGLLRSASTPGALSDGKRERNRSRLGPNAPPLDMLPRTEPRRARAGKGATVPPSTAPRAGDRMPGIRAPALSEQLDPGASVDCWGRPAKNPRSFGTEWTIEYNESRL